MLHQLLTVCVSVCYMTLAVAGSPLSTKTSQKVSPTAIEPLLATATEAAHQPQGYPTPIIDIAASNGDNEEYDEDYEEELMKDLRSHLHLRRMPKPFYGPVDRYGSKAGGVDDDAETDRFLSDMRKHLHKKKAPEPFFAPFNLHHKSTHKKEAEKLKTGVELDRASYPSVDKIKPSGGDDDLIAILNKHQNDMPAAVDQDDDLTSILNKHRNDTQATPAEVSGVDEADDKSQQKMFDENEEDDLAAIINRHQHGAKTTTTSTTKGTESQDIGESTNAKQNPSVEDIQPAESETIDASLSLNVQGNGEERTEPGAFPTKLAQRSESGGSAVNEVGQDIGSDGVVEKSPSTRDTGLFSSSDMTVVIAVAASASGLLIVLLVIVITVCCCCKPEARARRKQKELTTLNKDHNRWDPQMLRPSKESVDAFMFGPPIPSVSEMFSNAVLQINTDSCNPVGDAIETPRNISS